MNQIIKAEEIQNRIYTVRGKQVMLDEDLAEIYRVETRILNQAVKRNIDRFPEKFRFQITEEEYSFLRSQNLTLDNSQNLKSQFVISSSHGGRRKLPYVFTEQGVAMLSAVLRSDTAVKVSIQIMDAFVEMRKFLINNGNLFQRVENVEAKLLSYQIKTDEKIDKIFVALEEKSLPPKQGIFFNGQIFDANKLIADIIRIAKKSIILIDNYIDDTVLHLFTKRNKNVEVIIYTN